MPACRAEVVCDSRGVLPATVPRHRSESVARLLKLIVLLLAERYCSNRLLQLLLVIARSLVSLRVQLEKVGCTFVDRLHAEPLFSARCLIRSIGELRLIESNIELFIALVHVRSTIALVVSLLAQSVITRNLLVDRLSLLNLAMLTVATHRAISVLVLHLERLMAAALHLHLLHLNNLLFTVFQLLELLLAVFLSLQHVNLQALFAETFDFLVGFSALKFVFDCGCSRSRLLRCRILPVMALFLACLKCRGQLWMVAAEGLFAFFLASIFSFIVVLRQFVTLASLGAYRARSTLKRAVRLTARCHPDREVVLVLLRLRRA